MNGRPPIRVAPASRLRADDGVSLAELIVAIMILGVVLTVVTGTFSSLARATSQARTIDQATREATNGLDSMSRVVRAAANNPVPNSTTLAPSFSVAGTDSMTLISAVNLSGSVNKPQQTSYRVDATTRRLVETTTQSVPVSSTFWEFSGATSSRTLATPVAVIPTPLFRYYDVAGQQLLPQANGLLTDDQEKSVASVSITLSVAGASPGTDDDVTLSSVVLLTNLFPSAVTP